jgi:hypothetical protein
MYEAVKNRMTDETLIRFKSELNSFFILVLLNLVFGALAMAFGIQYIVTLVLDLSVLQTNPVLRLFAGVITMVGFGLGLSWVLTSTRMLRGIKDIRRESRECKEPVPPDALTGWIVRMTAHYRENQTILRRMIVICRLGGCVFVALGMVNLLQGFAIGSAGGDWGFLIFPFIAAAINLTIGFATIMISIGFHRYSVSWDQRLITAVRSEDALQHIMERR